MKKYWENNYPITLWAIIKIFFKANCLSDKRNLLLRLICDNIRSEFSVDSISPYNKVQEYIGLCLNNMTFDIVDDYYLKINILDEVNHYFNNK